MRIFPCFILFALLTPATALLAQTNVTVQIVNGSGTSLSVLPQLATLPNIDTPTTPGSATLQVGTGSVLPANAPAFGIQPTWAAASSFNVAANTTNTDIQLSLTAGGTATTVVLFLQGDFGTTHYGFPLTLALINGALTNATGAQTVTPPFLDQVGITGSGSAFTVTLTVDTSFAPPTNTVWSTDGTIINRDGQPFFAKAVNYAPTPIGAGDGLPQVLDWFTPPWWTGASDGMGARDLPEFTKLGLNSLRTYGTWFWSVLPNNAYLQAISDTSPLAIIYPVNADGSDGYPYVATYNHLPFLDACHANGISVVLGIALDGGNAFNFNVPSVSSAYQNFYQQTAVKVAKLYGNHPAVMGFCFGNEQNNEDRTSDSRTWDYYSQVRAAVKAVAPNKLFLVAFQNETDLYSGTITVSNMPVEQIISGIVDAWCLNIYSGMSTSLDSYRTNVVEADGGSYKRPLLITEWGTPSGKNVPDGAAGPPAGTATAEELSTAEFEANAVILQGYITAMQSNIDFVNGAYFFEYTDEWWKNKDTPFTEQNASTDPSWPEEFWGLYGIAANGRPLNAPDPTKPDTITERTIYTNVVKSGYETLAQAQSDLLSLVSLYGLNAGQTAGLLDRQSPLLDTPWGSALPVGTEGNTFHLDPFGLVKPVEFIPDEGLLVKWLNQDGELLFLSLRNPNHVYLQSSGWMTIRTDQSSDGTPNELPLVPPDNAPF